MAFDINKFAASALPLGGARPNLFQVVINTPPGVPNIGGSIAFKCRAASIPESVISEFPVYYFGRPIPMPGRRTFPPWTISVMNDESFDVRHAFETWHNEMSRYETNVRAPALADEADLRTTATVTQFSKTSVPIRTYEFVGLWPTMIGAIELNWENADAIEEFQVQFAYTYWRIVAPSTTGSMAP